MDSAIPPPPSYPNGSGPEVYTSTVPPPAKTSSISKVPPPLYPGGSGPEEGKKTTPVPAYPPGMKPFDSDDPNNSGSANSSNSSKSTDPEKAKADAKTKALLNSAKATAEALSKQRTMFSYTQGAFWGGPNADYTVLAVLAVFPLTGLLGLDHYYMRSPLTATIKTLMNVLTLGLWYFYDVGQVLTESDHVKKYGYSVPFFGPIGVGAELFPSKGKESQGASPLKFMLFTLIGSLGSLFGVDHLIAGDFKGFLAKFFALPIWIGLMWWNPLYWIAMFGAIIWSAYSVFRVWFKTEDIFVRGIARFWPFTYFMDGFKCANEAMGPKKPCAGADGKPVPPAPPPKSIFSSLLDNFMGLPIVGQALGPIKKTVEVAKTVGTVAVEVGKKTVVPIVGAAGAAVKVGADVVNAGKEATEKAAQTAQKFTDPSYLAKVAADKALPAQKGGGESEGESESTSNVSIYAILAATVGASFITQLIRKSEYVKLIPDILRTTVKMRSDLPPM
jgi:hypothetical protein